MADKARELRACFSKTGHAAPFTREIVVEIPEVEKYVPGEFFRRELPCIEKVIACVHERLDCIVIDGYVNLGDPPTSGLGQHLWERLGRTTPAIGVAKSAYVGTPEAAKLYRGGSSRPLYVTVAGIPLDEAKRHILSMTGQYRIPDILKTVDRLSRDK